MGKRSHTLDDQGFDYMANTGREAFKAGRIPVKRYATASSPMEGIVR